MHIGWTTVEHRADADRLAAGLITEKLAACVQVEGPIRSYYRWLGEPDQSTEFRLTVKFLPERHVALQAWLLRHHPYETPQWIVVEATHVAEKYLSWARANSSSLTL